MPEYDPRPNLTKPSTVMHADWSYNQSKRWMARAILNNGRYLAYAPEPVGDPSTLFEKMRNPVGKTAVVLTGFDFPVGVPICYARLADVEDFLSLLPKLGRGEWSDFYMVAERPDQISLHRPFYPQRPGGTAMRHLLDALGVETGNDLLRRCDRGYPGRPAAAPLFWTMGPKQVGKAAISGWRELLSPALRSSDLDLAIWPFDGELRQLLRPGRTVIVETYPAEFYRHLGIKLGSKRKQEDRRANSPILLKWADEAAVDLTPEMHSAIQNGFGPTPDGEDPFDAAIGLFGMLNVVLGRRLPGEPTDATIRRLEGWMLGQLVDPAVQSNSAKPSTVREATTVTSSSAEYNSLADLYNLEYVHDYDLPFWLTLAQREGNSVVEWGAGTGRLAAPLAEAGFGVTAVDVSENMLEKGREQSDAVEWVRGDMRNEKLGRRYDLAVCAFNSFLCLLNTEDAITFLRNTWEHLKPNGLLGIEVSAFRPEELCDSPNGSALRHDSTRELSRGTLERFSVSRYDAASQLLRMRLFYELYGQEGELEHKRTHELTIRIVGRGELELMLLLAGFEIEAVYGGFEGEPFTANSDHLIMLARRAPAVMGMRP